MDNKQKLSTYVMIEKMKPLRTRLTSKQVLNNFEKLTTTNKGKNQDALREEAIKQYENAVSTNKKISRFSLQWEGKTLKDKRKPELKTVAQRFTGATPMEVVSYHMAGRETKEQSAGINIGLLFNDLHNILRSPNTKHYQISFIYYKEGSKEDKEGNTLVNPNVAKKVKHTEGFLPFTKQIKVNVFLDNEKYKITKGFYKLTDGKGNILSLETITDFFVAYAAIALDENEFGMANDPLRLTYVHAIGIYDIRAADFHQAVEKDFNENYEMMDSEVKYIHSKYVKTMINEDAEGLKDLFINNYKYNFNDGCVINCILNKINTGGHRKKFTRERILKDINRLDLLNDEKTPLSINDIMPFFHKNKISFVAIDSLNRVIAKLQFNENERAGVVHIICNNGHCELCNNDVMSLGKIVFHENYKEEEEVVLSQNYYIKTKEDEEEIIKEFTMIESLNDVVKIIKAEHNNEKIINCILKSDNLDSFSVEMINEGIVPYINGGRKGITKISVYANNLILNIISQQLDDGEEKNILFQDIDEYMKYYNANMKFSDQYIINTYKSTYCEDDAKMERELKIRPKNIYFDNKKVKTYEYDRNKAYTHCLALINKVPVFNGFDRFENYNNEPIEDLNYYIIESTDKSIICREKYTRLYGFLLKYVKNYKIIYVKHPSNIIDVDFKKPIEELYKTEICKNEEKDKICKKNIVNILTGLLEKKHNKKSTSLIFKNIKEAICYKNKYDGKAYVITENTEEENKKEEKKEEEMVIDLNQVSETEESDDEDEDEDEYIEIKQIKEKENKVECYVVDIERKKELVNGFKYIKELIYNLNDKLNIKMYDKLVKNNVNVYALKTDAFFLDKQGYEIVKNWECLGSDIGQYKIGEKGLCLFTSDQKFDNDKPELEHTGVLNIEINNEFDVDQFLPYVKKGEPLLIEGSSGGTGKSSAATSIAERMGINLIFITPNNVLAQKIKSNQREKRKINENCINIEAITLHKLLGLRVNDDTNKRKIIKQFDTSEYGIICFDEIYFHNCHLLKKIKNYVFNNTDKYFLATGDTTQLEPVEIDVNNIKNFKKYASMCVKSIFEKVIKLNVVKRCSEEERETWINFRNDIMNRDYEIIDVLKKYKFKFVKNGFSNIKTNKCIAYYNESVKNVGNYIHKKHYKNDYEVGVKLVLRNSNYKDLYKKPMYNNEEYLITRVGDKVLTLEADDEKYYINYEHAKKYFIYNHCITGHGSQGMTFDEPITVLNVGSPYVSREWVYVVCTRNRSFKDVYIYEHTQEELNTLKTNSRTNYFLNKINGYKTQDKKAGREIDNENYIDIAWFNKNWKATPHCKGLKNRPCGQAFYIISDNGKIKSNITADRINNTKGHEINNCQILCAACNTRKTNTHNTYNN